jgi:hypothetical protein
LSWINWNKSFSSSIFNPNRPVSKKPSLLKPIFGNNGKVIRLEGTTQDITEQKLSSTKIEEAKDINLRLSAYPNPTIDRLYLNIGDWDINNGKQLRYYLYSMNGALLESKIIYNKETVIFMGDLATGVYYLRLIKDKKEIKSFKIIKN